MQCSPAPQDVVESVWVIGGPDGLRIDKLEAEFYRNPAGDFVLESEEITDVTVEALRPQMGATFGVDQLGVDADSVARALELPSSR